MHTKYYFLHAKKNFFEKCLFAYEIRFAVEKKNKTFFGPNFQNYFKNFCVAIKKMPVIQFPYMGIVS